MKTGNPILKQEKNKNMLCIVCKTGTTEEKIVNHSTVKDGYFINVKNVKAQVCNNCGEVYFEKEAALYIEQQVEEALQSVEKREVVKI